MQLGGAAMSKMEKVTEAANELGSSHFFSERQRCLAVLPTGFGKSLCYACLPAAFDKILEKEKGYSIVVSSHSSAGHHS